MKRLSWLSRAAAAAVVLLAASAAAQPPPVSAEAALHQLDAASVKFQSAEADFRWDLYERVVKQTTTETGKIYFKRTGGTTLMGARFNPPTERILEFANGTMRMFNPGSDHLTEMKTGQNQARYESFLTLGFGGSGRELARSWTVTDEGNEPVSDGTHIVAAEKLDLVAKEQTVRNMFTHITIWVDLTRGISLKQQFFTPSGDQRTATYTNIRYNQKVNLDGFKIKTDRKTTREYH